jgi:hypothetical protein
MFWTPSFFIVLLPASERALDLCGPELVSHFNLLMFYQMFQLNIGIVIWNSVTTCELFANFRSQSSEL